MKIIKKIFQKQLEKGLEEIAIDDNLKQEAANDVKHAMAHVHQMELEAELWERRNPQ